MDQNPRRVQSIQEEEARNGLMSPLSILKGDILGSAALDNGQKSCSCKEESQRCPWLIFKISDGRPPGSG